MLSGFCRMVEIPKGITKVGVVHETDDEYKAFEDVRGNQDNQYVEVERDEEMLVVRGNEIWINYWIAQGAKK